MHVDVNGTRLWFDVDGPALVPDGDELRRRPTVVLIHGAAPGAVRLGESELRPADGRFVVPNAGEPFALEFDVA